MHTKLLRLPAVLERVAKSRASLYNDIAACSFVPPVKVGPNTAAWPEGEVEILIRARIAGHSDEELRKLVAQLLAERRNAVQGAPVLHADK